MYIITIHRQSACLAADLHPPGCESPVAPADSTLRVGEVIGAIEHEEAEGGVLRRMVHTAGDSFPTKH